MSEFYTSVSRYANYIHYRGYKNGQRVKKRVLFEPELFVTSPLDKPTEWKNIKGHPVHSVKFDSMREAKEFLSNYEDVTDFEVCGQTNYIYQYITQKWPEEITFDTNLVSVSYIDIEVQSDEGFPEPSEALHEITAICLWNNIEQKYRTWGLGDYVKHRDDVYYKKSRSELELLLDFLDYWQSNTPDIITGWNSRLFDIPYIVNRINRLMGNADTVKRLSPWGVVQERNKNMDNRRIQEFEIMGVEQLDYYDLFKKFPYLYGELESYKLDHVAHVVLGERKMSYEEHGNLYTLYKNDHQTFIEYNIRDVELVHRLENECGFISLVLTMAYKAAVNYTDVYGTTSIWDSIIYRILNKQKIAVPPKINKIKTHYPGGYVKEPKPGSYDWVTSFDFNSLYPMIIVQYNMSPETVMVSRKDATVEKLLNCQIKPDHGASLAPTGVQFSHEKPGIVPQVIKMFYGERRVIKNRMLELSKEREKLLLELNAM